jgi:hypothetical protein
LTNIAIQAQDRPVFEERATPQPPHSHLAQSTTCYRLPGGRVVCSQGQGTNPSNGSGTR